VSLKFLWQRQFACWGVLRDPDGDILVPPAAPISCQNLDIPVKCCSPLRTIRSRHK